MTRVASNEKRKHAWLMGEDARQLDAPAERGRIALGNEGAKIFVLHDFSDSAGKPTDVVMAKTEMYFCVSSLSSKVSRPS